ncbi:energy transducer TonB [Myxococcus sp. CA040A]|uniref:energy transducer TonB family protein n=1 Tax=Myxococcus sp. CA040A TaxID=2741738 RepID=UPI00157A672C|nr:energy transducer TonB [Myxococcus sp. CA040A]NTX03116.1 energy transducer TonB [Myxococcus sp. CA040A]
MRPLHVVLCSLLLGATACGHSARIPSLPASHGHLSRAMAHYLDPRTEDSRLFGLVSNPFDSSAPTTEVEPGQARSVFAEAVRALSGTLTEEQLLQASADISAACNAGLTEACDYLHEQFQHPWRYAGKEPEIPRDDSLKGAVAIVVIEGRLGTDGRVRQLRVLESAPHGLTEALLRSIQTMRFEPAKLAGHPFEIPYTFQLNTVGRDMDLTPRQELDWARARARDFPASPSAWAHLARVLARDMPEDPWYANSLRYLNVTAPKYWWGAAELAWLHAQAGHYAEAEPLARVARKTGSKNPYVLETAALVAFHQGRCEDALREQQQAIAKLPAEWPKEEQERFQRALTEYQGPCPAGAPAPTPPRAPAPQDSAPQQHTSAQGS